MSEQATPVYPSDFCSKPCESMYRERPATNPRWSEVYREQRKCLWCWNPTRKRGDNR